VFTEREVDVDVELCLEVVGDVDAAVEVLECRRRKGRAGRM